MKLPRHLTERLAARSASALVAYLSTASAGGRPNTLPVPFTDVHGDELVLMPDLFAQKTKVNLNENRSAVLTFAGADGDEPVALEGRADIVQWGHPRAFRLFGLSAGAVLEGWGDWDETVEPVADAPDPDTRPSVLAQRGVIVFKPERVVEVGA